MPADHYIMDSDMKKVADAIRTKGQTTAPLTFPDGMVQAVNDIQAGGGTEVEDGLISRGLAGDYENDRITKIGQYAFSRCIRLSKIVCPAVTSIDGWAFENCEGLRQAVFSSVTSIERNAFSNCSRLGFVTIPKVETIGDYAFSSSGIYDIKLPYVKTITSVFNGCMSLESAEFSSLTAFKGATFSGCSNLKKVVIRTNQVATLAGSPFTGTNYNLKIYVPDNLVEQYKTATNWTRYASKIHPISEIPPEITP